MCRGQVRSSRLNFGRVLPNIGKTDPVNLSAHGCLCSFTMMLWEGLGLSRIVTVVESSISALLCTDRISGLAQNKDGSSFHTFEILKDNQLVIYYWQSSPHLRVSLFSRPEKLFLSYRFSSYWFTRISIYWIEYKTSNLSTATNQPTNQQTTK